MSNPFSSLNVDYEEDKSTNNLPRKLKKLKWKQSKNPTKERAIKIQELESIIEPTTSFNKKNKKKDESDDDILNQMYGQNNSYWKEQELIKKEYEEIQKKIEEETKLRKRKAKEEREAREKKEKEDRKAREKKEKKDREAREKKAKEARENENKIKIAQDLKEQMTLPNDIIQFISIPPKKDIYKKLALKYHPDKGGNGEYFKIINNHMN